jgi:hypothetical protein
MKKRKLDTETLIIDLKNNKAVPAFVFAYFENGDIYQIATKPLLKKLRGKQYTKANFIESVSKLSWIDIKPFASKLAYSPRPLTEQQMWDFARKSYQSNDV